MPSQLAAQSKSMTGVTAVIMTVFFLSPIFCALSPAMSAIAAAYPNVPPAAIGYVMTICPGAQALSSLIVGPLLGRKLSYKTTTIAAAICLVVAGCFPYFLPDGAGFGVLLASRAVLGFALGAIMVLSNSLVLAFFHAEDQRAKRMSMGQVMLNAGTIVSSLVGGLLCAISWQTSFLIYAAGIVLLILAILFLREPGAPTQPASPSHPNAADRGISKKIPGTAFIFVGLLLMALVCAQPAVVYTSQALAEAGITNSMVAAAVVTAFSVGGIAASLLFPTLYKRIHNGVLPLGFLSSAIGMTGCYLLSAPGEVFVVGYALCAALAGVSLILVTVATPLAISHVCAPEALSTAMGFVSFSVSAGSFLTTPFAQVVALCTGSDSIRLTFLAAGVIAAFFILVGFIVSRTVGQKQAE